MTPAQSVYACIGNSDDKLPQARWAELHRKFVSLIRQRATAVYGEWVSPSGSPWQNACVGFEIDHGDVDLLQHDLRSLAAEYGQDSIAWSEAKTRLLTATT